MDFFLKIRNRELRNVGEYRFLLYLGDELRKVLFIGNKMGFEKFVINIVSKDEDYVVVFKFKKMKEDSYSKCIVNKYFFNKFSSYIRYFNK